MNKYLFTDGVSGVKELQSEEDLKLMIESVQQSDKIKIWLFNSNEWISYAAFCKRYPLFVKKEKPVVIDGNLLAISSTEKSRNGQAVTRSHWLKKFLLVTAAAAGSALIFNFTKIKWEKASPVNIIASRPINVPLMDIDSLITEIEDDRGSSLDRTTRTNLRLRNTWPEKIELHLNSARETSNTDSRYSKIDVSIDNSTGFNLDEAIVKLSIWKQNKLSSSDTVKFNNVQYNKISTRQLNNSYRGDSISVSFESVRAKAFNFCYSAAVKNNSGNYNDRWFCRE